KLLIISQQVGIILDGPFHEVGKEHGTEACHRSSNSQAIDDAFEAAPHLVAQSENMIVDRLAFDRFDGGQRSRAPNRMAVVSSGEKHIASRIRIEPVHQLSLAAKRGDRIAVGHGLPESRQVRGYTADLLIATQAMTKPGDHFIKNENNAVQP